MTTNDTLAAQRTLALADRIAAAVRKVTGDGPRPRRQVLMVWPGQRVLGARLDLVNRLRTM